MLLAFTKKLFLYASSSRSVSPSRSGSFRAALLGIFPPNLATPSLMAASTAALMASRVCLSDFGIMRDTEYLGFCR